MPAREASDDVQPCRKQLITNATTAVAYSTSYVDVKATEATEHSVVATKGKA